MTNLFGWKLWMKIARTLRSRRDRMRNPRPLIQELRGYTYARSLSPDNQFNWWFPCSFVYMFGSEFKHLWITCEKNLRMFQSFRNYKIQKPKPPPLSQNDGCLGTQNFKITINAFILVKHLQVLYCNSMRFILLYLFCLIDTESFIEQIQ